jgi:hypothetical protein
VENGQAREILSISFDCVLFENKHIFIVNWFIGLTR